MKAIVIDRYGSADELHIADMDKPVAEKDEVLVRVQAVGINPVDYKVRSGELKFLSGRSMPRVIGGDFAGEVVETGSEVTQFKAGDAVYGMVNAYKGGAYAGYLKVSGKSIAPKPERLTFEEAASIPIAALTALQGLRDKAGIKAGMSVLVNGSTGGVGSFAVQIAKAFDARITGICSTENVELSQQLGADKVIDYKKTAYDEIPDRFDIVYDAVSFMSVSEARVLLKKGGVYVYTLPTFFKVVMSFISSVFGSRKFRSVMVKPKTADLQELNRLVEKGQLKPLIEKIYPMNEMAEAHRHLEKGHTRGKIVVKIDQDE